MKRCLLPISPSLPFSLEGELNAFGLGLQSLGLAGRLPSKSVTAFIAAPVLQAALHVTGLASDVSTTGLPSWRNEKQLHFFRDCRVPCGRGKVLAGAGQVLPPSRQRRLFAVGLLLMVFRRSGFSGELPPWHTGLSLPWTSARQGEGPMAAGLTP